MGEVTGIAWTDATISFWWGCTKVGPGCDFCYAESWDKRTGGDHWGVGVPRRKIKSAVKTMRKMDNEYSEFAAEHDCLVGNAKAFGLPAPNISRRRRVFVQSMSDLFDLEVDVEWFREAWECIESCDRLDIQILTKRVSAVEKRLAEIGRTEWPKHAGLMITVVNQQEANRDIPRLIALKKKLNIPWIGLSMEPLLEPVDLTLDSIACGSCHWCDECGHTEYDTGAYFCPHCDGTQKSDEWEIDYVIVGGESGRHHREFNPDWARSLRDQCKAAGVAFFFKQMSGVSQRSMLPIPDDLMVREFPK